MKEVDKNKIDELFKAGLNREDDTVIPGESGWSELEHRLDLYEKRKRPMFRIKSLAGIAALFLLVFSIWMIRPVKQERLVQESTTKDEKQEVQEDQKRVPSSSETTKITNDKRSELSSSQAINEPGIQKLSGSQAMNEPVRKPGIQELSESKLKENAYRDGNNSMVIADTKVKMPKPVERDDNKSVYLTDSVKPDNQGPSAEKQRQSRSIPGFTEPINLPEPQRPQIALSLLLAPAYNGADNLNNGRFGSDIGLLVTLGLTNKWSLSTGAVYAKKLYETGYTYASYTQMVDADCRVLDIPVNVSYALVNKGKTRIGFGTGISSYIMLKEDYRFNSSSREDIHLVNENQHWLSVLNVQASYERKLNSRISLYVQPYLKVPFNDIGYYKIKLQSLGMAVGASWSF
ncbi:MAG: hypothetical protein ABFD10_21670 [Prolixibacteraceae bacterium]